MSTNVQQQSPSSSSGLTNWTNEPTLQQLKFDYQMAKSSGDTQTAKIQRWNDLLHVRGSAKPAEVKGRSKVQPKVIRRQAEWRFAPLSEPFLGSNKLFRVSPRTWEDAEAARQNELLLEYQFTTKLNRVKFIDDFVRSVVEDGTAVIRVGWFRRTVKVQQDAPVWTYLAPQSEEQVQMLQQAVMLADSDPHGFQIQASPELKAAVAYYRETGQPNVAQRSGTQKVAVEQVIENRPTAEILDPANVLIDPSCQGDLAKARFVMVSFETSKADLQAEGRYKNLDRVNWEGAAPVTTPDHTTQTPGDFNFNDPARKRVVAVEYWGFWDIRGNGVLEPIVATWIGDVLIRMELNPFPDQKLPFVVVPYLPVKRELWGEPDAELLEDQQKVIGALMRGMIDLLGRSANSQQGFAKGMLDPLNRRRFENGQDYEFNPNLTPAAGLIEHKYPELPQSGLLMLNLQNQEAEALTGVKSFSGGLSGQSFGDVAAGIRGVLDAASKREMSILRRLAQGISELGRKIIAMNAVFLSEEEVIRVTNAPYVDGSAVNQGETGMGHNGGPPLEEQFQKIRREDLKGEFDLKVDISTAEIDNAQAQDLAFMLQTLGNTVDVKITLEILAEICRLKRMPELAHKLKTWQPQPSPFEQQMQQLQLAEAKAKVDKLQSEINLNNARAQAEQARAQQVQLDTTEQATGIAHARNIDQTEAQAQGNKELQVTKALTSPRKEGEGNPDIEAAIGYNQLTGTPQQLKPHSLPVGVDNLSHTSDLMPVVPGDLDGDLPLDQTQGQMNFANATM